LRYIIFEIKYILIKEKDDKMKKRILLVFFVFGCIFPLVAEDSNGETFHFRPTFKFSVPSVFSYALKKDVGIGPEGMLALAVSGDFLFYIDDDFCMGIRTEISNYLSQEGFSFTDFSFGYHFEHAGFFFTAGAMFQLASGYSRYLRVSDTHTLDTGPYNDLVISFFWGEVGYILNFNKKSTGVNMEFGLSMHPLYMRLGRDSFTDTYNDTFNEYIADRMRLNVGIGYTF
jgi:hypothetical protein